MASFYWGQLNKIPEQAGVYWLSYDCQNKDKAIDIDTIRWWVSAAPSMSIEGIRANPEALKNRLAEYLKHDVVYIGSSNNLRRRLSNLRIHILGDVKPHRGGQWVKTLTIFDQLRISIEETPDYIVREAELLEQFMQHHPRVRGELALPFANLRYPDKTTKNHGISHVDISATHLSIEKNASWKHFKTSVLDRASQDGCGKKGCTTCGGYYQVKKNLVEWIKHWELSSNADDTWPFLAERDLSWIRRSLRWFPKGGFCDYETTWRHVLDLMIQTGMKNKKQAVLDFLERRIETATLPDDLELVELVTSTMAKWKRFVPLDRLEAWTETLVNKVSGISPPLGGRKRDCEGENGFPGETIESILKELLKLLKEGDLRRRICCEKMLPILRWDGLTLIWPLLSDAEKDGLDFIIGPIRFPKDLQGICNVITLRRAEGKSTAVLSRQATAYIQELLARDEFFRDHGAWKYAFSVMHTVDDADALELERRMVAAYWNCGETGAFPGVMKAFLDYPRNEKLILSTLENDLSRRNSVEWALEIYKHRSGKQRADSDKASGLLCEYILDRGNLPDIIRFSALLKSVNSPYYIAACRKMASMTDAVESFRMRMDALSLMPDTMEKETQQMAFDAMRHVDHTLCVKDLTMLEPFLMQASEQDGARYIKKLVRIDAERTKDTGELIEHILGNAGMKPELLSYLEQETPLNIMTPRLNQLRRKLRRQEKMAKLEGIDCIERLKVFADEEEILPNFYPDEWADVPVERLKEISEEKRERLAVLLAHHKQGAWKLLRIQILKSVETIKR